MCFLINTLTLIQKLGPLSENSTIIFALKSVFSPAKCDFLLNKLSMLQKKSDIFSDVSVIFFYSEEIIFQKYINYARENLSIFTLKTDFSYK